VIVTDFMTVAGNASDGFHHSDNSDGTTKEVSAIVDAIIRARISEYWERLACEQIEDEFGPGAL
jgi:hypothetical protein